MLRTAEELSAPAIPSGLRNFQIGWEQIAMDRILVVETDREVSKSPQAACLKQRVTRSPIASDGNSAVGDFARLALGRSLDLRLPGFHGREVSGIQSKLLLRYPITV